MHSGLHSRNASESRASDQIQWLTDITPELMESYGVPGVSIALVEGGKVVWTGGFGVKNTERPDQVSADTVFEAASMSKPFFAYLVLQLVQEGLLELDKPLYDYLGTDYTEDQHHRIMTARMVLSHQGGFPNWRTGGRNGGQPIPLLFEPGTGYTYSGEGYWYLQQVIEHITGKTLDHLCREKLFVPLGMQSSSFIWRESYIGKAADGHAQGGGPIEPRRKYHQANAAFTLYTTASDYARFLVNMMELEQPMEGMLLPSMAKKMITPETAVTNRKPIVRGSSTAEGKVHFGLGWRIDQVGDQSHFCHSGSNRTGFRCYAEFNPASKNGIVILTNSADGHHLWQAMLRKMNPL